MKRMDLSLEPLVFAEDPDDTPFKLIKSPKINSNDISDFTQDNSNRLTKKVYKKVLSAHYGIIAPEPLKKNKKRISITKIDNNNADHNNLDKDEDNKKLDRD
jgi:hypothetical protein